MSLLYEVEKVPEGGMRSLGHKQNTSDGFSALVRLDFMTPSMPITYARAKHMRTEPTSSERKLWGALRNRALLGHKFVRQQPIGPYIVDFVCREKHLIVEVDGATHGDSKEIAHDERRTEFLTRAGYRVYRVWSVDIYGRISDVLDGILIALGEDETR